MMKLSIIIPTLQKNKLLLENLIQTFIRDNTVGEIIVIDNSLNGLSIRHEKLRVVVPDENLFVNPSWNLGISMAQYSYFGIINDDIIVQNDFCSIVMNYYSDDMGLLGIDKKFVIDDRDKANYIGKLEFPQTKPALRRIKKRENNFGVAIFGKKENYTNIPNEIKIWCGDDYLFDYNIDKKLKNYVISGLTVYHVHNLSSSVSKYDLIKENDIKLYNPRNADNYNLTEKIFSVKNTLQNGSKRKTICIAGFKFTI